MKNVALIPWIRKFKNSVEEQDLEIVEKLGMAMQKRLNQHGNIVGLEFALYMPHCMQEGQAYNDPLV